MANTVRSALAGFGARISVSEVKRLENQVGAVPDRTELQELRAGRREFLDSFSDSSLREYDRYVGRFKVVSGEVRQVYSPFRKQWKVDASAAYRAKWGAKSALDARAPTFECAHPYASLPSQLRSKFTAFAKAKSRELTEKRVWAGHDASSTPSRLGAWKVADRERRHVGYVLRATYADGKWLDSFYRADATPIGWDDSTQPFD